MSKPASYSIIDTLAEFDITTDFTNSTNVDISDYVNELTNANASCHQLVNDSRALNKGDVFCAVIGSGQDGREYIDQAIASGALLILAECQNEQQHGNILWRKINSDHKGEERQVAIVQFYQLNHHLFAFAMAYYQQPQNKMVMIGLTGTNGKTSTSQLIAKLLEVNGKSTAVIGTNGAGKLDKLIELNNTTPGATQLSQLLAKFVDDKVSYVAMEVSSHALEQRRVTNELFDIALFTNLSRDHLDYHHTMENYAQAKKKIFTYTSGQVAIINGDDEIGQQWLKNWPAEQSVMVYGRSSAISQAASFVQATNIKHHAKGVSFLLTTHLGEINIDSPLMADFNVDNLLAAIAVLMIEKVSLNDIADSIAKITAIIGRMETITENGQVTAVVDYAHTPDALENALKACRQHCQGELWVVFGCGGDRDKGKRALMGGIAEDLADHLVITNDNPRSEAPEMIVSDILSGCQQTEKVAIILDRQQAVLSTLSYAKADDIVLFAGKGHEDYILIADKTISYNERDVVRSFFDKEGKL